MRVVPFFGDGWLLLGLLMIYWWLFFIKNFWSRVSNKMIQLKNLWSHFIEIHSAQFNCWGVCTMLTSKWRGWAAQPWNKLNKSQCGNISHTKSALPPLWQQQVAWRYLSSVPSERVIFSNWPYCNQAAHTTQPCPSNLLIFHNRNLCLCMHGLWLSCGHALTPVNRCPNYG